MRKESMKQGKMKKKEKGKELQKVIQQDNQDPPQSEREEDSIDDDNEEVEDGMHKPSTGDNDENTDVEEDKNTLQICKKFGITFNYSEDVVLATLRRKKKIKEKCGYKNVQKYQSEVCFVVGQCDSLIGEEDKAGLLGFVHWRGVFSSVKLEKPKPLLASLTQIRLSKEQHCLHRRRRRVACRFVSLFFPLLRVARSSSGRPSSFVRCRRVWLLAPSPCSLRPPV
ncbi:hypothetical protein PIB30_016851 [Stylosanthes scabra]|uniref:Uncharacterized protein n=1 Tax=Stylosanthes scabra TaxID=79078 RepID=A0ABU6T773_9FABA|nr:hypothetical protein [Stylosanthes scabra]